MRACVAIAQICALKRKKRSSSFDFGLVWFGLVWFGLVFAHVNLRTNLEVARFPVVLEEVALVQLQSGRVDQIGAESLQFLQSMTMTCGGRRCVVVRRENVERRKPKEVTSVGHVESWRQTSAESPPKTQDTSDKTRWGSKSVICKERQ